jgi:hypothetical protein
MNRKIILVATIATAAYALPASATIINIPDDYLTIQQGIDASADGDTVLVQPGTYVENINFNGHNITLGSLFLTTEDTTFIAQTIIDGDSAGSVVTFGTGENRTAVLTGFTVRDGYSEWGGGVDCRDCSPTIIRNVISSNLSPDGAGIYCRGAAPLIAQNVITENTTWFVNGLGGGIKCSGDSTPVILGNLIAGNQSVDGAGIYCEGDAVITGNRIIGNAAVGFEYMGSGGGIDCANSNAMIAGNLISGNSAGLGAGIACFISDVSIWNNVISGNNALFSDYDNGIGGGIYCHESSPAIINSAISENAATVSGAGIYCALVSNPSITNTILWGDSAIYSPEIDFDDSSSPAFRYCDIEGGWGGEGNIDTDPLFRDPENSDFHLMSTACGDSYDSPCIDAGHPDILDSLLDCSWGLGELRSDMGAYGGGDSVIVGIDDKEIPTPDKFMLFQNYPNPFNAATTISYSLPEQSEVIISIYNLLGQRVAVLHDGAEEAGSHSIKWDASDFPSGIYFARLEMGDHSENIKMVLLK